MSRAQAQRHYVLDTSAKTIIFMVVIIRIVHFAGVPMSGGFSMRYVALAPAPLNWTRIEEAFHYTCQNQWFAWILWSEYDFMLADRETC